MGFIHEDLEREDRKMLAIFQSATRFRFLVFSLLVLSSLCNAKEDLSASDIVKGLNDRRVKRFTNEEFGDVPDFYDEYILKELFKGPVCDLIDMRNSPNKMAVFENCTIVNGFVQLSFMHDTSETEWKKYSFPKLRVITHYLLIFRVYGLRSLRDVFPNLVVIGGDVLFKDYSLIVYENPDLNELGIESLRYIKNGRARIQRNSRLCYLSTIDWARLGNIPGQENKAVGQAFLQENYDETLCNDQCGNRCPQRHCWGYNVCQKDECPSECPTACMNGICGCHELCLAGCTKLNDPSACLACTGKYHNGTCVNDCPPDTYLMEGWNCATREVCTRISFLHQGVCMKECPPGYLANDEYECIKCVGEDCGKHCNGNFTISDTKSIDKVRGCKIITGRLTIAITDGAGIVQELDEALESLEDIQSLVVTFSFPLISLSFLRNLKIIRGDKTHLYQKDYSVYVLDNRNLRELWEFDPAFKITGGKALFHFNTKLCLDRINKLAQLTATEEDDTDISQASNGDTGACLMENLEVVEIRNTSKGSTEDSVSVNVRWKSLVTFKDYRTLIGYQIYYKLSPQKTATRDQGMDACGKSDWNIENIPKDGNEDRLDEDGQPIQLLLNHVVKKLKPYQQYAMYMRAYMTSSAKMGARSEISYFTSAAAKPSEPRYLSSDMVNETSIRLWWHEPEFPNGILSYYIIRWRREQAFLSEEDLDNACKPGARPQLSINPNVINPQTPTVAPAQDNVTQIHGEKCCKCEDFEINEDRAKETMEFENFLHNHIFLKAPDDDDFPAMRKRRSVENNSTASPGNSTTTVAMPTTESSMMYEWHDAIVINETSFTITGLHHFSEYDIQVYVCNHASTSYMYPLAYIPPTLRGCSIPGMLSKWTQKNATSDDIHGIKLNSIKQKDASKKKTFVASWIPPMEPNGYILYYSIETTLKNQKSKMKCYESSSFIRNGNKYKIPETQAGDYILRVRAVTRGGEGNWSDYILFEVEAAPQQAYYTPVLITVIAIVCIVFAAFVLGCYCYRKKMKEIDDHVTVTTYNPEYVSSAPYKPDEYEVSEDRIEILVEIGHGNFGKVFSGFAKGVVAGEEKTKVAIKKLHENASAGKRYEFLEEATNMKCFNSTHVVRLIGVCSTTPESMVIMEYMEKGDLKNYLRSRRPNSEENVDNLPAPTLQEKLQMAAQIADGMAYLADVKFVHRDLAARNCLVNSQDVVKISDFGLSRDIYETDYYRKESRGFLPIRWMAPESLKDGIFNARSDVWSYGIVLWELATLAEQPYYGRAHDEVTKLVIDGGFMEQPKDCPRTLYDLMLLCWQYSPSMRPQFIEIVQTLVPHVNEEFKENSYWAKLVREANEQTGEEEHQPSNHQSQMSILDENNYHQQNTLPANNKCPPFPSADTPYDYYPTTSPLSTQFTDESPNTTNMTSLDTSLTDSRKRGSTNSVYDYDEDVNRSLLQPEVAFHNGKMDAQYSRLNGIKLLPNNRENGFEERGGDGQDKFRDYEHLLTR